ncbi:hypothetical protein SDC9_112089 [bioreactor metagenome]|uniref:Uncharacterized protein n=1 Tax=bioreactor metagenome TaxID=1076179 RepID=A0A645BJ27_9ZZZZ
MNDGIRFTYVGKELIAQTFSFTRSFYKACDIHNLYGSRDYPLGFNQFFKYLEPFVRNYGGADIWFYCTKRKVCRLSLARAYAVKKG